MSGYCDKHGDYDYDNTSTCPVCERQETEVYRKHAKEVEKLKKQIRRLLRLLHK